MLTLVAPVSMTADQQTLWLASAVDALDDIRAAEVAAVSAEVRREVTRPSQVVPAIARLVAARRSRGASDRAARPAAAAWTIDRAARERRAACRGRAELAAAWRWECDERRAAGLDAASESMPLSRAELAGLSGELVAIGVACGALEWRGGELVDSGQ